MSAQQTSIAIQNLGGGLDQVIGEDHFGGIYIGYRSFDRYESADQATGLTSIRWPGGAASEKVSWYGLEFDDLVDPASGKPGLSDMALYAVENDVSLSVIIPTGEYKNDLARAQADFAALLGRIEAGAHGPMPAKLTFEIGNEYYAMSEFRNDPGAYGEVANAMAETFADFVTANPGAFAGTQVQLSAQIGKSLDDNAEIIAEFSAQGMSAIDTLVVHRFAWGMDDADNVTDRAAEAMDAWVDAGLAPDYDAYLSGWNVGSWTRTEARDKYIELKASEFGDVVDKADIDLNRRNHAGFENFWQSGELTDEDGLRTVSTKWGIANRDYGLAQASAMVEILSNYVRRGIDAASLYGVDTPYAAHVSWGDDVFVGGAMMQMMSETLPGLSVIDTGLENARDMAMNVHAFEGDGRVVLYVSIDELMEGFDATVDLAGLGLDIIGVQARSLTSELDLDWMTRYDIVDRADIDESAESRLYETGIIAEKTIYRSNDTLSFSFDESFEVVEITLTVAGSTTGTSGDDLLVGGTADDVFDGGAGDDHLDARGGGADILTGGMGEDVFVFGSDGAMDVVTDFETGVDKVDLSAVTEGLGMVRVSLGEFEFVRMRRFEDNTELAAGEIIFEQIGDDLAIRYMSTPSALAQQHVLDIVLLEQTAIEDMSLSDLLI